MSQRLSRHTLFQLRNDIPIDSVITQVLMIPNKVSEGFLRFLCPLCLEFNSATNPNTNLARCFRCHKNFNPIDLVMAHMHIPFRQAADLLLPLLPSINDVPRLPFNLPPPPSTLSENPRLR